MTSQEATFWVSTGLLVAAIIVGGIGASAADNRRYKELENICIAIGGALGCMAGVGYIKWVAGFFFN